MDRCGYACSAPVEVFAVQVAAADAGLAQATDEGVDHDGGPAEEDRQPARVVVDGVEDVFGGEVAVGGGVVQVYAEFGVGPGDGGDFVGEGGLALGGVEQVDPAGGRVLVEGA